MLSVLFNKFRQLFEKEIGDIEKEKKWRYKILIAT